MINFQARTLRQLVALSALMGSGCDTTSPMAGFEESLTRTGGCGDMVLFAVDEDDEVMLRLDIEGLLTAVNMEPSDTEHVLPEVGLALVVEVGEQISDATCDDAIENGGPQVDRVYIATAGTAWISTRPTDSGSPEASADLLLEDVIFEDEATGEILNLESFEITDAFVGWVAG